MTDFSQFNIDNPEFSVDKLLNAIRSTIDETVNNNNLVADEIKKRVDYQDLSGLSLTDLLLLNIALTVSGKLVADSILDLEDLL